MKTNDEIFLYPVKPFKRENLNVAIAFPGVYNLGMSALGYLSVFKFYDTHPLVNAERIFTDTSATKIHFSKLNLLAFSMSFELDFISIFKILSKFSIPFKASERDESFPLISGGGPVLSSNPAPFAAFFDYIEIGDAEVTTKNVIKVLNDTKGLPKKEILNALSKIPGVYVPSVCDFEKNPECTVTKATAKLTECLATPILTPNTYFKNTFIMEIARGCPQKCSFCNTSFLNFPYRPCPKEEILKQIDIGISYTDKIAFLGAAVAAHPDFEEICDYVLNIAEKNENLTLGVSSLRADKVTEKVIKTLVKCNQKHATIAVEAGNDRLRSTLNKNLTDEQILDAVSKMSKFGLKGVKVYAMTGLPDETAEDLNDLIILGEKMKKVSPGFNVSFTLSNFIPKAHTPFCKEGFQDVKILEKKGKFIKKEMHKRGINVNISSPFWDAVQTLLSRGDDRLSDFLVKVYEKGCDKAAFRNVKKEFIKKGLITDFYEIIYSSDNKKYSSPSEFIKLS